MPHQLSLAVGRILLVVCALPLGACSIYSETRHQQGLAAKQAWSKVDLAGQLSAARANEAALLAEQLRLEETLARASRDRVADGWLLGGSVESTVLASVRRDLGALVKFDSEADQAAVAAYLKALDRQATTTALLRLVENEFARFGLEMPACPASAAATDNPALGEWVAAHPGFGGNAVAAARKAQLAACADLAGARAAAAVLPAGALKDAIDNAQRQADQLEAVQKASVDQRNSYRAAAAALDAAMAANAVDPHGAAGKVDTAVARLASLMAAIAHLPDSYSAQFVSAQRAASINAAIAAVQQARTDGKVGADASVAVKLLVPFPDLYDRTRVALAEAATPRMAPLVLMKHLEKVKADAAARDVASQNMVIALTGEKVERERERLRALRDAYLYLTKNCQPCLGWRLAEALQPFAGDASQEAARAQLQSKARVLRAATLYLDARGRLAAASVRIDYQINALAHERALAQAEAGVGQWNTLITAVVEQMHDFGETGIRKEDVAGLVSAAALLWIGKGVN